MKLATMTAAILLAGVSFAAAQSTMSPSGSGNPSAQGKCWNAATNTVQDKATQGMSGKRKSGGVTTGSGTSGNATNSSGQRLQTRPAGMPSC